MTQTPKIILAVVITAVVVGGGIYGSYFWPLQREVVSPAEEEGRDNISEEASNEIAEIIKEDQAGGSLKTVIDDVAGISFQYPESLGTEFISTESWPPKIQVASKPFICDVANAGVDRFGKIEERVIGDNTYCVSEESDGAAGTTYTGYNYAFLKYYRIIIFDFTLGYPACDNFDESKRSDCKSERASFDVDSIVEQMAKSIIVTK